MNEATVSSAVSRVSARQKLGTVLALQVTLLLAALDQTVVTTAMPVIVGELRGFDLYAWATSAYLLASTAAIPVFGRLSDIYGRKLVFISGVIAFGLSSILCGAAGAIAGPLGGMEQLIAARVLQGLSAGTMMCLTFAVIADIFDPAARGKYQGVFAAVFALASLAGPTLGGWITETIGWRWVFFINIPIAAIAALMLYVFLPRDVNQTAQRQPFFPRELFQNSIIGISCLSTFVTGIGMFGSILLLPLLMQSVLGMSATASGAMLSPLMVVVAVASVAGGLIVSKTRKYKTLTLSGLAIMAAGTFLLSGMKADTTMAPLLVNMAVVGIGLGLLLPVYTIVIQNVAPAQTMGLATALSQFFRSVGGTVGTAIFGYLMNQAYWHYLSRQVEPALWSKISALAADPLDRARLYRDLSQTLAGYPNHIQMADALMLQIKQSLVDSINFVFLIYALMLGATFVVNLFLREVQLGSKK